MPKIGCGQILESLRRFGGDAKDIRCLSQAAFGRDLRRTVPEDDYDRQPLIGAGGRCLLVADARIDNRNEVIARLGLNPAEARRESDAALLLGTWERHGLACVDHLLGDFAFAVWEEAERRLTLARSPMAQKPLFYTRNAGFIAFATMPDALCALDEVPAQLDRDEAAAIAGEHPFRSDATLFVGIRRVLPGHAVVLTPSSQAVRRLWNLDRVAAPPPGLAEAGEALSAEFDRAVGAQLRRRGGKAAAQLSSGRDSSAVAVTAATLLGAEPLVALTAAPRAGFGEGEDAAWLPDESAIAAQTAALWPNVDHRLCRSRPAPVKALFDLVHRHHFGPMLNSSNVEWSQHTFEAAKEAGATILLTGAMGNLSISRGGPDALVDVLREDGAEAWWRLSRALNRADRLPWRTIGNATLGPWLPRGLHQMLLRASGRGGSGDIQFDLLRPPLRAEAEQIAAIRHLDRRPARSLRGRIRDTLYATDNADLVGIGAWGIEQRDPTADRRLIELCHSLAARQMVAVDSPRPAYQMAFGNRLPQAVVEGRRRGFQAADWIEVFQPGEIRAALADYAANPLVAELIDMNRMGRMLDRWPAQGGYEAETIQSFGQRLLNTVALAGFVAMHFGS